MLQGFGIFTTLTPAQINEVDVIRAMDRILEAGPPDMLMTLDSVAAAPTIRQAARVLGAHHNSVRHRVTLAERELGLSISDTYGRSQLFMGLMLRRLRETYETYPLVNADV